MTFETNDPHLPASGDLNAVLRAGSPQLSTHDNRALRIKFGIDPGKFPDQPNVSAASFFVKVEGNHHNRG
jgi:hypothetical protein